MRCGTRVTQVVVRGRRAVAVRLADGSSVDAARAVVADVDAPQLFRELVGEELLPASLTRDLRRFHWDNATVKVGLGLAGAHSLDCRGMPDGPAPSTSPAGSMR